MRIYDLLYSRTGVVFNARRSVGHPPRLFIYFRAFFFLTSLVATANGHRALHSGVMLHLTCRRRQHRRVKTKISIVFFFVSLSYSIPIITRRRWWGWEEHTRISYKYNARWKPWKSYPPRPLFVINVVSLFLIRRFRLRLFAVRAAWKQLQRKFRENIAGSNTEPADNHRCGRQ